AMLEQVTGAPGLDLPGLDVAAVARGYGVTAQDVTGREELTEALRASIAAGDGPRVIQVPVASGMWLEEWRASRPVRRPAGHPTGWPRARPSRCVPGWSPLSAPTGSSPGRLTSSATPRTPAPTG